MRFAVSILTLAVLAGSSFAADFNGIKFLMISSADKAVVVRDVNGELKLLKKGDRLDDEHRIVNFENNHVILEGPGEWAPEKLLVEVTRGETQVTRLARRPLEKYQLKGGEVTSFKAKSH